jgi:hypothetical protein
MLSPHLSRLALFPQIQLRCEWSDAPDVVTSTFPLSQPECVAA